MKRILASLMVLVFTFAVAGLSFAADNPVKGTITKIEDKKVTVIDEKGNEASFEVKDAAGLKVGDKVEIKNGVVKKAKESDMDKKAPKSKQ
ncbi:selenite/tellurite reduction operon protein ExtJ [Thermodesulfovibrio thiophilus]|uniref:selenite/tellurite reduction operon protein ExtJ n=1 Tax=Thermodesulfovibrio thiophilus TaxID=340095 RepID=UPI0018051453|nr:hypothetical protein [Thermodesulfovibrio thiophilus]HHW21057.1 hypothetical protein [Thermodesulfovibrio thiophilus]